MKTRTIGRIYKKLGKRLAYELNDEKGNTIESIGILQPEELPPGKLTSKIDQAKEDPFSALRKN